MLVRRELQPEPGTIMIVRAYDRQTGERLGKTKVRDLRGLALTVRDLNKHVMLKVRRKRTTFFHSVSRMED